MSAAPGYTERRAPVPPNGSGMRIASLLTGVFIGTCILKLCGVITWSWAVILAPVWIPWCAVVVFVAAALLAAAWA